MHPSAVIWRAASAECLQQMVYFRCILAEDGRANRGDPTNNANAITFGSIQRGADRSNMFGFPTRGAARATVSPNPASILRLAVGRGCIILVKQYYAQKALGEGGASAVYRTLIVRNYPRAFFFECVCVRRYARLCAMYSIHYNI